MITYLQENYVELIGASTSLLYLFFEINQKKIMWVVGFISSAFYVYIFFHAKFYADMGLNIYYLLASVYGWIIWTAKNKNKKNIAEKAVSQIKNIHLSLTIKLTVISIALFAFMAFILSHYTDSPVPYGDALVTSLSIVATWMLAHKIIEQWWVWLFVNTLSMGLFLWRGLYPTAILFFCYATASVIGYHKWKKEQQAELLK